MFKTDIAFKSDINKSFLPFVTAFMVFIASIIFATSLIGNNFTNDWNKYLKNNVSIQVLPDFKAKHLEKDIELRIKNIINILKITPGIKSYSVMDKTETENLIKPWIENFPNDLILPRIINIEISPIIPFDAKKLITELEIYSKNIKFETYSDWMYEIQSSITAVQILLGLIVIIILITVAITISYATRSGLNINKKVINIMHMVGATNDYISKEFSKQMMKLALIGGSVGYLFSCFIIFIIKISTSYITNKIIVNFEFSNEIYLYILIIPVIAGVIAKVSAMLTIKQELNNMV